MSTSVAQIRTRLLTNYNHQPTTYHTTPLPPIPLQHYHTSHIPRTVVPFC